MGVALLSGCLYRSRSCLKSSSITCPPRDPAIEQRSATFAGTDKSLSESSSAVLTRDLLSATVSVFSFLGIHFSVNAYRCIFKRNRRWHTWSGLSKP
ncbi:hypothetical protein T4C_8006 [Trichinella pseudospiralis]|uniref:Uncharacterized protein n=1 Tax=Trichinella pseudospiralis TaxID=6337 RepID=A0A0V1JIS0_TRIPS|nr:hypothetical protein T4C_8006 [Trichinella pseudospiralis]